MNLIEYYWSDAVLSNKILKDFDNRYELVERPTYKKKRLEQEKKELETWLEYNRKQVLSTEDKLAKVTKELDGL
jgi:hypothetical protein